jgi:hypothetical protein
MGYPRFTALPKNGWWFSSHFTPLPLEESLGLGWGVGSREWGVGEDWR